MRNNIQKRQYRDRHSGTDLSRLGNAVLVASYVMSVPIKGLWQTALVCGVGFEIMGLGSRV